MAVSSSLTKIEAVNIILRSAREFPIASLTSDTTNESLMAEQVLDEWDLREQAKGLFNNTFEREFTPDSDDEIVLPENTLYITGWAQSLRLLLDMKLDTEGDGKLKLWNLEDNDFDFSDKTAVCVQIVEKLPFVELSPLMQLSIIYQAAQEYQMAVVGSRDMNRHLLLIAGRSRAEARAENIRKMRPNMFNNSRSNLSRAQARVSVSRSWSPESDGSQRNRRI